MERATITLDYGDLEWLGQTMRAMKQERRPGAVYASRILAATDAAKPAEGPAQ
jgi:hypothetical protein